MLKVIISILLFCITANTVHAQPTREDLEKQKQQLKKDIDEAQKQLNGINSQTKGSLSKLALIANKERLQERLVEISGKDIHILDDNIYLIQKDINRYDHLLDTLKQQYAKSMVYSYKNRGNYEFLNFIFSADNFNDAVKRISYLKSYRNYREMQGENILRTQELRRKRLEDLGASKEKKQTALQIQSKEAGELADQKAEQDKVVADLKKQGKDLNARIAAKQKDMAKVNAAVKAAIAKAIKDANDARIAAEKKRREDLAAAAKNNSSTGGSIKTTASDKILKPSKVSKPVTAPDYKDLNGSADIELGASFEKNRGILPWPVDNGAVIMHFGRTTLGSGTGTEINSTCVTISSSPGSSVKAVFDGVIILVKEFDEGKNVVTVKHGTFYTTYSNLDNVIVKKGEEVKTGQTLGKVALNFDGIGATDFYIEKGTTDLNPESWLRQRR